MHMQHASTLAIGAVVAWSVAAHAADNTRHISIAGNNTNACTLAAPCRTLQRGINATPAGGELRILDSGFYGNNAIVRRSLTISGNGNTVYLGTPITVDGADAVVALRDLVLDGQGTIGDGIFILAAAALHIERCVIHGFTGNGIVTNGAGVELFVFDSTSRNNGAIGLNVFNSNAARVTIDNSHFDNNGVGIWVEATGPVTIRRSTASGNGGGGVLAVSASVTVVSTIAVQNGVDGFFAAGSTTMTLDSSVAHGNGGAGLDVFNGALARISNSIFTANETGIINNGTLETRGNNIVKDNTTDLSGNAPAPLPGV